MKAKKQLDDAIKQSQKKKLENSLEFQLEAAKIRPFEREFRFCHRKWRFDFAWPELKFGVEVQGGIWNNGAHVRGVQYDRDCRKLSAAVERGWRVIYVTNKMINDGSALTTIERVIKIDGG